MPLFKVWSEDKLNKKFVVAENFAELVSKGKRFCLRSTKWNANLILLRDYAELVSLCKVIVWKTHIPVRTQK